MRLSQSGEKQVLCLLCLKSERRPSQKPIHPGSNAALNHPMALTEEEVTPMGSDDNLSLSDLFSSFSIRQFPDGNHPFTMKPNTSQIFSSLAAVVALSLATVPMLRAETVSGRITLRGEMQNADKPGSISFTYSGQLTGAATGDKVNVTGGGLFRSTSDEIAEAVFRGDLTTYRRFPTTITSPGRLQKRLVRNARVTVSRRFVRFAGASVTLDRAIDGSKEDVQRISGRGSMRFRR